MARLKAHGIELLRLRREFFISSTDSDGKQVEPTKHYEETSYRSDGKILRKLGYWQTATPYQTAHWYDWGWKLFRKLRPGVSMSDHVFSVKASLLNRQVETAEDWKIV